MLPAEFSYRMQQQLGKEFAAFNTALTQTVAPTSVRLHPHKITSQFNTCSSVLWCTQGRYLPQRPSFTLDPLFHAGTYYVQEASSMFLAYILAQIDACDKPIKVLDLCAAPGGKSTLLNACLHPDSLVVANEVIKNRANILAENLIKWGNPNIVVTNNDPKAFSTFKGYFDIVLVDAPCSGEGLFRKEPLAMQEWSTENVALCAARQKRILAEAAELVHPNGYLIYSTCTYSPAENEDNVHWLLNQHDMQFIAIPPPKSWQISTKQNGYQFYPHCTQGEGLFITCVKKKKPTLIPTPFIIKKPKKKDKKGGKNGFSWLSKKQIQSISPWIAQPERFAFVFIQDRIHAILLAHIEALPLFQRFLYLKKYGVHIGSFKGKQFVPSHELAVSTIIHADLPHLNVTKEQALAYLRKQDLSVSLPPTRGWHLIRYKGHNLGWVKVLPNRINNYYPKQWRIRMNRNN